MRLQVRIRQVESEPRRQCFVEGAVWIGCYWVIFVRQKDNERNRAVFAKELQAGGYPWVVVRSDGEPALLAHVKAARAMTIVSDVPLEISA